MVALSLTCGCGTFSRQWPVQKRAGGESQKAIGVSGEPYHIGPEIAGEKHAPLIVDLRERADCTGITSATTAAGRLVGDDSPGSKLSAGSPTFS